MILDLVPVSFMHMGYLMCFLEADMVEMKQEQKHSWPLLPMVRECSRSFPGASWRAVELTAGWAGQALTMAQYTVLEEGRVLRIGRSQHMASLRETLPPQWLLAEDSNA